MVTNGITNERTNGGGLLLRIGGTPAHLNDTNFSGSNAHVRTYARTPAAYGKYLLLPVRLEFRTFAS